MKKGINIADPEILHGVYSLIAKQPSLIPPRRERVCVFISHKDADTAAAIEIGNHIMNDLGFDIYLDVYDKTLQKSDAEGNLEGIVSSIQKGIGFASHLLCVISDKSKDSWWMPYEIGFAQAHGVNTASIIIKNTEYLPTYLRVEESPVFDNIESFDAYMAIFMGYGSLFTHNVNISVSQEFEFFNTR